MSEARAPERTLAGRLTEAAELWERHAQWLRDNWAVVEDTSAEELVALLREAADIHEGLRLALRVVIATRGAPHREEYMPGEFGEAAYQMARQAHEDARAALDAATTKEGA